MKSSKISFMTPLILSPGHARAPGSNDRGQTIEKLRPAVKQTESAEVHTVELTVGEPVGI